MDAFHDASGNWIGPKAKWDYSKWSDAKKTAGNWVGGPKADPKLATPFVPKAAFTTAR